MSPGTAELAQAEARTVPEACVLVVDDNAAKRTALRSVLLPLGYPIVEAASGQEALRALMRQDFAVILLDVRMPGMDGFATAKLIRQRRQSEMTPIIFMTADARDDLRFDDRYVEGAVDFLVAPFLPREIQAKVAALARLHIRNGQLITKARDLQSYASRLLLLTDSSPVGIFHADAKNRYTYVNPQWAEITGVHPDDAVGRPWDSILDSAQRDALRDELGADGSLPAEFSHRFELAVPDGPPRIVFMMMTSMFGPGAESTGLVGTLADITVQAGAETEMIDERDRATEGSRLKSDFLANMSHEIRTPMNGVLGMADLLLDTNLDHAQRDYVETMRNSGDALMAIINDILDFSKVEAGQLRIEHIEFSPHSVLDGVLHLLGAAAREKGLILTSSLDAAVPAHVTGDPGRVRQVLTNLIGNAIKFTDSGEVCVHVGATDLTAAGRTLRIEVTDTGAGIVAEKLDSIFQPFIQADSSTSRRYGGTGLGLSISAQLVELMGGQCGVISGIGSGSTFWFTIQTGTPSANEKAPVPTRADPVAAPLWNRPRRLLLAEDNMTNQKVAVAMLKNAGYEVDTVLNGAAAVAAATEQSYDLILMDCHMPELDGYAATAAIRAAGGSAARTPIVAMTAGARAEDRARCLAGGMDGYLAKPVRRDALLATVQEFIRLPAQVPAARKGG